MLDMNPELIVEHYGPKTTESIFNTILNDIQPQIDTLIQKGLLIGGIGLDELKMTDGVERKSWVEFEVRHLGFKAKTPMINIDIRRLMAYKGDMPDQVLDRYNILKGRIKERLT